MRQLFTEHPASVGESYLEHLKAATGFGIKLLLAGAACLLHGLLPFAFERTGSKMVESLHDQMINKRRRDARPDRHPGRVDVAE